MPKNRYFLLINNEIIKKNAAYLLRRAAQATIQNTNTTKRDILNQMILF